MSSPPHRPSSPVARVIALFGPTGIGKTAVAVAVARLLRERGEQPVAVSADALQVYQGIETLTGVATRTEQRQLEHRLVSFLPLDASFSAGQYAELAHAEIDNALAEGRRPIVVGGTGLYLRAALTELDLRPPPPEGVRERWTAELERYGAPALHARLAQRAPWAAQGIDPNDRQRIVRSLELLDAGELHPPDIPHDGEQASSEASSGRPSQLWTNDTCRPTLLVGLVMERDALYERIDRRVDAMIAAGVRDEVLRANALGAGPTARKALGFDELLAGDVEAMKRHTRNYARRQLTWMRKLAGARLLDMSERTAADAAGEIALMLDRLESRCDEPSA
jgi:tRNA dimethylallyltransferase